MGWVLIGAIGAFSVLGVLMNWLWALLAAGIAMAVLFILGVHAVLGSVGVAVFIAVFILVSVAVIFREWKDTSHSKEWFSKLTED